MLELVPMSEENSMEHRKEQKNREELFKLIQEHPDLPIVPMVDYEIIGDDCGRWIGSWGSCYIGEYIKGKEQVYFKEEDDPSEVERVICDVMGYDAYGDMSEEEADRAYEELPWIKAVVVDIDLPE